MYRTRIVCLLVVLACLLGLSSSALALEVDCDTTYCFTAADFGGSEEPLSGICITTLPDANTGTVMLGSRVLKPGDILTAGQLTDMRFVPLQTEQDQSASVSYLPIYENHVAPSATTTISIMGKENKAPVAEDSTMETYKNLANEGKLKVADPEGSAMTFTVIRQPKRGELTIREDGSFLYTPKKNKVGVDSFVYTATDEAGKVSREATVTITILKPVAAQYSDTAGESCQFTAEWMKNTGIFEGEKVNGQQCFNPDKSVSRGEFLVMLTKALNLPVEEEAAYTGFTDEFPAWLQPYLAAALRSGLTANWPDEKTFGAEEPVTGAEAALMLQNVLDLSACKTEEQASESVSASEDEKLMPAWAADAMAVMADNGIPLNAQDHLTRAQVGEILYQASTLAETAPGLAIYR